MAGKTLHIGTQGYHTPPGNLGSNPLSLGSDYRLGPDSGIFGVAFSPDTRSVSRDDIFSSTKNPFLVQITNADLMSVVHGSNMSGASLLDVRIRIGGVVYLVPVRISKKIRGKNGARVFWKTTTGERGSFRLFRRPPAVF